MKPYQTSQASVATCLTERQRGRENSKDYSHVPLPCTFVSIFHPGINSPEFENTDTSW